MLIRTLFVSLSCSLMFACASSNNSDGGYSMEKLNAHWFKMNLKREGVVETSSGLQYKILEKSSGCKPDTHFNITVHYKMLSANRKQLIDSSYQRGHPSDFKLSNMIKGWREGVPMMNVGESWELYIPSQLAYGSQGSPAVAPNSLLISQIKLINARCES